MKKSQARHLIFFTASLLTFLSCHEKKPSPTKNAKADINLKRGALISCGPTDKQFGSIEFATSCSEKVKPDFNLALALLHSFEYDEAEKAFVKIIDAEPECAMAYWGVAMANFHPLWAPPAEAELQKGAQAIEIALALKQKNKRETDYLQAIATFYTAWNKVDHRTRCINYEKAMEHLYAAYPTDNEAAVFYALALTAAADVADKSFVKQKKAGAILNELYPGKPNHPGIVHYIIHTYDYPQLAEMGLPAAKKYAAIAPSSAHALHMPSHIFTRLGLWQDCINSNTLAAASAKCYAENTGIKGHWDEELHAMDYLVYAYLQKGENNFAKAQCDYLKTIQKVEPANFKVAYAFASIPARYVLENKNWKEAAAMQMHPVDFPWQKFPWQKAIVHFTRVLGLTNTGNTASARTEWQNLKTIYDTLVNQKDSYKAMQVQIQINAAEAWLLFKEGKKNEALTRMHAAADMEDKTEKHPVTPSSVVPARELLGDMFLAMKEYGRALQAYEASLQNTPNRFNALYGAATAALKINNTE
ncbi:MAG: hypothetical protein V4676_08665, partial [Bacteroidota bacterium]